MKLHIKYYLLILSFLPLSIFGQNTQGDKAYENLEYQTAIDLYKSGKHSDDKMVKLANAYRLNHDTQNAEKWYAQIVEAGGVGDPINILYYAQALHSNGKIEQAKRFYQEYNQATGGSDLRGERMVAALKDLDQFNGNSEILPMQVRVINSTKLDFSPVFFEDGIVFVSNRNPEGAMKRLAMAKDHWTGEDYNAHYISRYDNKGNLKEPEPFSLQLADRFHEGPLCFSKSGDQVFFTRNQRKKSKSKEFKLKLYTAHREGEDWGAPEAILADEDSNDAHPSLSVDGLHLYFASDREGGFGGMDIYRSTFSQGSWGIPVNLGPKVNTAGNEVFPFVYDDGTLYFASDGWGGLGGLDIFYSDQIEADTRGQAKNLGTPFNSNMDDFGYVLDVPGTEGYFTSARGGSSGKDDIYKFRLKEPQENKKSTKDKNRKIIANSCVENAITSERIPDATVNILAEAEDGSFLGMQEDLIIRLKPSDTPGEYIFSLKRPDPFGDPLENQTINTDEKGDFKFEVRKGVKYMLLGNYDQFKEGRLEIKEEDWMESKDLGCIQIQPASCVSLAGVITNKDHRNPIENATVTLINLHSGESLTTNSDQSGTYEFNCIPCEKDYVLRVEKSNFKAGGGIANTYGMDCDKSGDSQILNIELMPVYDKYGRIQAGESPIANLNIGPGNNSSSPKSENDIRNLLTEGFTFDYDSIYYDFDKHNIRSWDASIDLDKVADLLNRNPDYHVILGSHTDSRGTVEYNNWLSGKRAEAAVAYILKKGVEGYRISARGYGESQLVNHCSDGVPCTEAQHQRNRRTSVKLFLKEPN